MLADAKGRKLVVALGLIGLIMQDICIFLVLSFYKLFHVRDVFFAPASLVLGGGSMVISATTLAIIANASPEAMRYVDQQ